MLLLPLLCTAYTLQKWNVAVFFVLYIPNGYNLYSDMFHAVSRIVTPRATHPLFLTLSRCCCCNSIANVILYVCDVSAEEANVPTRIQSHCIRFKFAGGWKIPCRNVSTLYTFLPPFVHPVNSIVSSYCTINSLVIGCQDRFQLKERTALLLLWWKNKFLSLLNTTFVLPFNSTSHYLISCVLDHDQKGIFQVS